MGRRTRDDTTLARLQPIFIQQRRWPFPHLFIQLVVTLRKAIIANWNELLLDFRALSIVIELDDHPLPGSGVVPPPVKRMK